MAPRIEILGMDGPYLHYEVRDGDVVLSEKRANAAELAREAAEKNVRLVTLLKRREGATSVRTKPAPEPEPADDDEPSEAAEPEPESDVPLATNHRHDDILVIRAHEHVVPEHEHPHEHLVEHVCPPHTHPAESREHEHPHEHGEYAAARHRHEILEADVDRARGDAGRARGELEKLSHELAVHGHPFQSHEHPVPVHEHDEQAEQVRLLSRAVLELRDRLEVSEARPELPVHDHAHEHAMPEHTHAPPVHSHPEYEPSVAVAPSTTARRKRRLDGHDHVFGTNKGDGWRCSICGTLKGA